MWPAHGGARPHRSRSAIAAEDDVVARMAAQEVGVEQVATGEPDGRADRGVEREAVRVRARVEVSVAEAEVLAPK